MYTEYTELRIIPFQDPNQEKFKFHKSLSFTLSNLTFQRRWSVIPEKSLSAKMAFMFVSFLGILVHGAWKGGIISHLTFSEIELPFRSLEGMHRQVMKHQKQDPNVNLLLAFFPEKTIS